MSQLTSLSLVNKILVNLRDNAVTDLTASNSQLLLELLNQAKEKVEDAWRWKILSTTLQFTTTTALNYTLSSTATPTVSSDTGSYPNERAEVLTNQEGAWSVYDVTTASSGGMTRLARESWEGAYARNIYLATQSPVQPNAFAYSWGQTSGTGNAFFSLVGAPTAGRILQIRMKCPQEPFTTTAGTELLQVPWRPVVSWATYLALEERGEELSESSSLYRDRHNAELQRAIEKDMAGEEGYEQLKNLDS